jgi:hypothetical protein
VSEPPIMGMRALAMSPTRATAVCAAAGAIRSRAVATRATAARTRTDAAALRARARRECARTRNVNIRCLHYLAHRLAELRLDDLADAGDPTDLDHVLID